MNQQIKEIRTLQIVAVSIMKNLPDTKIKLANSPYCDLIVSFESSTLVFGVEVKNSGFLRTNHFKEYINRLKGIDLNNDLNRIPILLAVVNEEEESVKIGFVLAWQFGKAKIYQKPALIELNLSNAKRILDLTKSMDESIRFLSEHGMKVIKTINVRKDYSDGRVSRGSVIYLRDFTKDYKMSTKDVVTEREKMERLIHGTPQNEYPDDDLDRLIFESIKERYPKSTKVSDLMLFSTELRNLQMLAHTNSHRMTFHIIPELDMTNPVFVSLLSGTEVVSFAVDIFFDSVLDIPVFENQLFDRTVAPEGWFNTYKKYSDLIATLKRPQEFFVEEQ